MAISALASTIRDGLLEIQGDLVGDFDEGGPKFVWRPDNAPVSIECVPNMQGGEADLVFGGHDVIADFSLIVLREHFITADSTIHTVDSNVWTADNSTPVPVRGKRLKFRGKYYKVTSATLDSTGVYIRLALGDKNSGR